MASTTTKYQFNSAHFCMNPIFMETSSGGKEASKFGAFTFKPDIRYKKWCFGDFNWLEVKSLFLLLLLLLYRSELTMSLHHESNRIGINVTYCWWKRQTELKVIHFFPLHPFNFLSVGPVNQLVFVCPQFIIIVHDHQPIDRIKSNQIISYCLLKDTQAKSEPEERDGYDNFFLWLVLTQAQVNPCIFASQLIIYLVV